MSDSDLDAELNAEDSNVEVTPEPKPEEPSEDAPKDDAEVKDAPEDEEKSEPMVPVSVLVAERKESRERLEFAESVARQNAKPTVEQPTVEPLDFLSEPEKITGYIDQRIRQATDGLSKSYAVRQHGKDVVDKAYAAVRDQGTPAEQQALQASDDPWGDVVDWHRKREALVEIGGDPVAWREAETKRIRKELLAEAAVKQAKGIKPAPSLADEPNIGARANPSEDPDDLESLIGP